MEDNLGVIYPLTRIADGDSPQNLTVFIYPKQ